MYFLAWRGKKKYYLKGVEDKRQCYLSRAVLNFGVGVNLIAVEFCMERFLVRIRIFRVWSLLKFKEIQSWIKTNEFHVLKKTPVWYIFLKSALNSKDNIRMEIFRVIIFSERHWFDLTA